ncbi:pyridoxal phosphate-dependent transferase [Mycena sp. CBHHK59/15]|nr:pyridoxal phosphate-dependent transferase [Mycena sp. CBHHK59/15]
MPPPLAARAQPLPAPHYSPPPGPYYHPALHPDGIINLTTAENSLLSDRLLGHLSRPIQYHEQHLKYRVALTKSALPSLDDLLPEYINDHFAPRVRVTRENSLVGPGIGAILAQLVWALAGEGEGVLMTNPFYDDYVRDITHPARVRLLCPAVPATVDPLGPGVLPLLERAIVWSNGPAPRFNTGQTSDSDSDDAVREGEGDMRTRIKVLFLTNPHNPLPRVVGADVVRGYAQLAEKYDLHLIVDEVYALSTFSLSLYPPTEAAEFRSILCYDVQNEWGVDPARVHVLTGPTKDLGCSGLKAALLTTPNLTLLARLRPLFGATPPSAVSDALLSRVLSDKPFVARFLEDNREELRQAYERVARWAEGHGLGFTRANAGVYVLVDFAPWLVRLPAENGNGINILNGVHVSGNGVYANGNGAHVNGYTAHVNGKGMACTSTEMVNGKNGVYGKHANGTYTNGNGTYTNGNGTYTNGNGTYTNGNGKHANGAHALKGKAVVSSEDVRAAFDPAVRATLDRAVAAMLREGVFLKPTSLSGDPIPTRFRVVFSHPRATIELALRRIEKAFGMPPLPFED